MIAGAAICEAPVAYALPAQPVYAMGAALAGRASVRSAQRALFGIAAAARGQASTSAALFRFFTTGAALTGRAGTVAMFQRRAALQAELTGTGRIVGTLTRSTFGAAALVGSATTLVDTDFRLYAATQEFITRPEDVPLEQPFHGTLQKALRLDRSIIGTAGFDRVTATWGHLELINAEGDYDYLIDKYTVDGRRVVVKAGIVANGYSSFLTLFDGTATDWQVAEDVLTVEIRDNTYQIEVPASPRVYAGTGGIEGGADLKGKRRPRALGDLSGANLTPPLVVPEQLAYQVNDGPVQAIPRVYDRAVALTFARDYGTVADLLAAGTGAAGSGAAIEAGRFATCLAAGWFKLGGAPVGQITCDVLGDRAGGAYVDTTPAIVRRLLAGVAGAEIRLFEPSFRQVETAQTGPVGYWLDPAAETTVADIVADLMAGIGGYGGFRRNGSFEVGVFRAPVGIPTARYTRTDIIEIERQKLPDGLSPPPWRYRVAWGRNWTVQTDVDGQSGVTAARVAFLAERYRLAASDATAGAVVRQNHPLAQDPAPVESYFRDEADAAREANRRLALFGRTNSLYRIRLKAHPFVHEIGEEVHVTFPRWDLRAGRSLRIVALTEDTDENATEIIGFG